MTESLENLFFFFFFSTGREKHGPEKKILGEVISWQAMQYCQNQPSVESKEL